MDRGMRFTKKKMLLNEMNNFSFVRKVYPSDANFFLLKVKDAEDLYTYLSENEIVVRNRSKDPGCDNCLRITVGTQEENKQLINLFKGYEQ